MAKNSATAVDFALVHDFPVGTKVWVWWGCMHWRRAVVRGHTGPWVQLDLDGHPYKSRSYPRHHLLRHRFDDQSYPSTKIKERYSMTGGTPLDMTCACAVAAPDGRIVGWRESEADAAKLAREMAVIGGSPYFLLVPTQSFSTAEPPVRVASVRRRKVRS